MKTYRSNFGPFTEKPFFKPDEIESICADELHFLGASKKLHNDPDGVLRELHGEIRYSVVSRCRLHFAGDVLHRHPLPVLRSDPRLRQFSKMSSRGRSSHAYSVRIDAVLGPRTT